MEIHIHCCLMCSYDIAILMLDTALHPQLPMNLTNYIAIITKKTFLRGGWVGLFAVLLMRFIPIQHRFQLHEVVPCTCVTIMSQLDADLHY